MPARETPVSAQDDVTSRIDRLRRERNALILAHNYQNGEVQDVADHVGDSLELARIAAVDDGAEVIVFCGVHFMAETAVVLRPDRPVYMPDPHAGCPLADMITVRQLRELRERHPGAAVISYVNTSAEIKALSDVCCTSANAAAVVESVPADREVLFVPDRNLGDFVRDRTGRGNMVLWNGFCPTHNRILAEHVERARAEHPGAPVVVHPECRPEVRAAADEIASTGGMVRFCRESPAEEFVIGTEIGMLDRLRREQPDRRFWPVTGLADCPNMKLTTLEKILWELEDLEHRVTLPPEVVEGARRPIERMVQILGSQ
jgi:quinolinate synthase